MFSLLEALAGRDEFECLVSHTHKDAHFSFALTFLAARKEVSKFYKKIKKPLVTTYSSLVHSISLVEWSIRIGCVWDPKVSLCVEAAKSGHLEVLKWASTVETVL